MQTIRIKSRSNTYDSIVRRRYLNSVDYVEEEERKKIKNKQTNKKKERNYFSESTERKA